MKQTVSFAEEQASFRQFRSVNQQVAFFNQAIKDALDKSHMLTDVFIDLKSAYETIRTDNLLLKVVNLRIKNNILGFMASFANAFVKLDTGMAFPNMKS